MEPKTIDSQLAEKQPNFIVRLFRGDVSLFVTYWLFGTIITKIVRLMINKIIESNYLGIAFHEYGTWIILALNLVGIGYFAFASIAIWRSSGKYQGNRIWARLARLSVVVGVSAIIFAIVVPFFNGPTEAQLAKEMNKINKSLPTMIEDGVRFDHISYQDKTIYYRMTFVSLDSTDIDVTELSALFKDNLCDSRDDDIDALLSNGRKAVFKVFDRSNKLIKEITLDQSSCL